MKATYQKYTLHFKRPSGTSRGVMFEKDTYFLHLFSDELKAIGECGILKGLSIDDRPNYEDQLKWVCKNIALGEKKLLTSCVEFPSIQLGIETAFASLRALESGRNAYELFPSGFLSGKQSMQINGLIWMGEYAFMRQQIIEKIEAGFSCIKLKIGALHFEEELALLHLIRKDFSANEIELRVDANGAFKPYEALEKLKRLSELDLHSIEQPIGVGQWEEMASLCAKTPLPIALDEELIGIFEASERDVLLKQIQPQYIILKPSLIGGFVQTKQWIDLATTHKIGWWITSALESNIGLNAIAQFTYLQGNNMPQGLGTGSLYANNFESPLCIRGEHIWYDTNLDWNVHL